jgi:acylphosphatase
VYPSTYTLAMIVARRLVITGRVQNVGFRFFAVEAASFEGLSGWVQNRPDGRVEILVEGDRDAVRRFEAKVRRGPGGARVDDVRVDDESPSGQAGPFVIRA